MIKRIGLLMVAALMAAMMMVATAAPAFAVNTCKEEPTGPPPGQQPCQKGSTTIVQQGASDNEKCFKKGERVECR